MAFERISLNIIPDGEMPVFHASQFDAGRPIIIDLYNGDDAYTPAAGVTFELHCRKVDDNIVTLDTYEVDGNTITFASTEQLCACSGDNICEVAIMHDELLMGTLNFILRVERDPIAGGLISETSIYNLTQQIDDIISGEGYVKDTDLDVLQSDWNETDENSPAYIKNKPGPALADQADWTETDPLKQSYIKHKPDLKTVATSGSYNDLTDKPIIPTKTSELTNDSGFVESSDLAAVATSGDYDDLLNKPYVPVYTENETPYQIRTAPAGNNRTLEKLIGCSCAFNQLINVNANTTTRDGVTFTKNNDGSWTLTGTPSSGNVFLNLDYVSGGDNYLSPNHVYYLPKGNTSVLSIGLGLFGGGSDGEYSIFSSKLVKFNTTSGVSWVRIQITYLANTNIGTVTIYPQLIDLTAMFGSEVADYFYNLETQTAGAGVAKFRQLFPESYYAYQTATLISAKPVSKKIYDSSNNVIAEYPLGSDEIRGVFKIENGELVAYGDIHNSDGTGVKYFEERAYSSGDENLPNAITDGTKTVVALATPVSTTYTAFSNPMICGSTEEFMDSRSVKMPCGHDSLYYSSPFKGW